MPVDFSPPKGSKVRTKILVSGFEAFGGQAVNPTQMLIEDLRANANTSANANEIANIQTVLLPVVFRDAFTKLEAAIDEHQPDVVLALGQAGGRDAVELERIAINLMDGDIPDNNGFHPRETKVHDDGHNAHFSTLPLQPILAALKSENIPARISNTAGLYVCNDLFYRLQASGKVRASGFVHFPYLPEQTTDKPSMPFATMKHALATILETLSSLSLQ